LYNLNLEDEIRIDRDWPSNGGFVFGFRESRTGAISAQAFDLPERPPDPLDVRLIWWGKDRWMRIRSIALCFGLAVTPGFAVTAHAQYTSIVLPDAGGASDSIVRAINSLGESVGYSSTPSGGLDAVLWSASGTTTMLMDLGRQGRSAALAINNSGESVGGSLTATGEDPVLWSPSGAPTLLGGGSSGKPSAALAINGKGESVGYEKTTNGYDAILWHPLGGGTLLGDPGKMHFAQALAINGTGHSAGFACTTVSGGNCADAEAVLWGPGGTAKVLQDVKGGVGNWEALAINASGYSVGWAVTATGKDAVRWSPTATATVLQGLKGSTVSEAVAENNLGLSIGYSNTAKGDDAILWGPKGGIKAVLKDPGGQGVEFALAINNSAQSVGYADIAGGGTEAVLWGPLGHVTNLEKFLGPDWSNTEAVGINNAGDIIGYGNYHNGSVSGTFGFLLTPTAGTVFSAGPVSAAAAPELSTWAMLVVGFAGLGFAGFRNARVANLAA
jgi:hypothetical protein